jgi:hypothetical protein
MDSDNKDAQIFLYILAVVFFPSIVLLKVNQTKQKFKAQLKHILI